LNYQPARLRAQTYTIIIVFNYQNFIHFFQTKNSQPIQRSWIYWVLRKVVL